MKKIKQNSYQIEKNNLDIIQKDFYQKVVMNKKR